MRVDDTRDKNYTSRLVKLQSASWKQRLRIINPYRLHLRGVCRGSVLEVGCGVGRVLDFLGGSAIGIDHNEESIRICRSRGLAAFSPNELLEQRGRYVASFDVLLASHVMEHMSLEEGKRLIAHYLPFLKKTAKIVLITPQERGYLSDSSHKLFVDFEVQVELLKAVGFERKAHYSFPFPRLAGRVFVYNEFVSIGSPAR